MTDALPSSLRNFKSKKSVSAAIRSPETASRIRLDNLTERVLDPLSALLNSTSKRSSPHEEKGPFLLSPSLPSTLDCLALGYLALFLLPEVPLPFLSTKLKEKYPSLADYIRRDAKRCYGEMIRPEDARVGKKVRGRVGGNTMVGGKGEDEESDEEAELHHYTNMHIGSGDVPVALPWRTAEAASPLSNVGLILQETVREVPVLGGVLKPDPILRGGVSSAPNNGMGVLPVVAGLGLGVAAIAGAVVWGGGFGLGSGGGEGGRESAERLRDLGETGDLLGLGRRRANASFPAVEGGPEGGLGVGVVMHG